MSDGAVRRVVVPICQQGCFILYLKHKCVHLWHSNACLRFLLSPLSFQFRKILHFSQGPAAPLSVCFAAKCVLTNTGRPFFIFIVPFMISANGAVGHIVAAELVKACLSLGVSNYYSAQQHQQGLMLLRHIERSAVPTQ